MSTAAAHRAGPALNATRASSAAGLHHRPHQSPPTRAVSGATRGSQTSLRQQARVGPPQSRWRWHTSTTQLFAVASVSLCRLAPRVLPFGSAGRQRPVSTRERERGRRCRVWLHEALELSCTLLRAVHTHRHRVLSPSQSPPHASRRCCLLSVQRAVCMNVDARARRALYAPRGACMQLHVCGP